MPSANDLRRGQAIKWNNELWIVLEVEHRTPGNLRAFVQATLRNVRTRKSSENRFSSTEKVDVVETGRQKLEFSYSDPQGYHFMDPESYETVSFDPEFVSGIADYLVENTPVEVLQIEGRVVQIELPPTVNMKVVDSPEGLRGDTATNVQKPAKLETGKTVQVPLFIKEGEIIKIDTRTGEYMGRA